jgi:hypothetical protein
MYRCYLSGCRFRYPMTGCNVGGTGEYHNLLGGCLASGTNVWCTAPPSSMLMSTRPSPCCYLPLLLLCCCTAKLSPQLMVEVPAQRSFLPPSLVFASFVKAEFFCTSALLFLTDFYGRYIFWWKVWYSRFCLLGINRLYCVSI